MSNNLRELMISDLISKPDKLNSYIDDNSLCHLFETLIGSVKYGVFSDSITEYIGYKLGGKHFCEFSKNSGVRFYGLSKLSFPDCIEFVFKEVNHLYFPNNSNSIKFIVQEDMNVVIRVRSVVLYPRFWTGLIHGVTNEMRYSSNVECKNFVRARKVCQCTIVVKIIPN